MFLQNYNETKPPPLCHWLNYYQWILALLKCDSAANESDISGPIKNVDDLRVMPLFSWYRWKAQILMIYLLLFEKYVGGAY